ncbi:MAG: ATP-binding protein [Armatimonadetes bacterium]|nr:ATP-binding protein [Armatimonadota bacterium]
MSNIATVAPASPSSKPAPLAWDAFLHPAVAALATVLLLGLCTYLLVYLRVITNEQRPYTILYLVPVAVSAALLGVRGGVAASLAALALARIFLLNDQKHGADLLRSAPKLAEDIEFAALAVGTMSIAAVTGRLRETLGLLRASNGSLTETNTRLERANAQLVESERQRREFNRDVLLAVTGGKLRLAEPDEVQAEELVAGEPVLIQPLAQPQDASTFRRALQHVAYEHGMDGDCIADLCTSATEAATNAIKHGEGGSARVWVNPEGIAVEVRDQGKGIAPAHLARATLEAGYSTRISLGMGFHIMLQTADALTLCTSDRGTTVLLQVSSRPRATEQESLLARYASL